MLTQRAISTAEPIRDELARAGKVLRPVDGTVIEELTNSTLSAETKLGEIEFGEIDHTTKLYQDAQQVDQDEFREHDTAYQEAVDEVAEIVEGNLHLARSKIIPAAKEVYDLYAKEMERIELDAAQPAYITPNVYHPIWNSDQLISMVERFANTPMSVYRFEASLPELSVYDIEQHVKTGIESFDELISSWFEDQSAEKILEDYRRIFVNREVEIGRATNAVHEVPGTSMDRNSLLLAFLVANGFDQNVPEGVDNVSLDQLRLYLARMKEQAARAVYQEIERRRRDRDNQILVYRVASEYKSNVGESFYDIRVNDDVYRQFLEDGGTPETIYGAVMSGDERSYHYLLENKRSLESKWNRYLSLFNQRLSSQTTHYKRESIRVAFAQYINSVEEDDLPARREQLHQRTEDCVAKYDAHYFTDEMIVIRDMVAGIFYPDTNAKMIFRAMDEVERSDPDLDARECALFATIDLVARWIASQIEVADGSRPTQS